MGDLSRSGNRLRGFCRTNLFKRLESSGHAFVQSVERHILRNYVYLHALEHGEPLPIGTQNVAWLDTGFTDADNGLFTDEDGSDNGSTDANGLSPLATSEDYRHRAAQIYETFREARRGRFRWLDADHFVPQLAADLQSDSDTLREILVRCGPWDPERDTKLEELYRLAGELHSDQKLIVFSQFSDTVDYLTTQLQQRGIDRIAAVTGSTSDPTRVAWRFSPNSNGKRADISESDEYRILIATDVLSEGQNLQDAAIIVNFDLPWAIIRLFQRAGRVDRIGQQARDILCYTFLPAEGVERIIQLRSRVRQRLKQNLEVVGTDEAFFEDDGGDSVVRDLFTEQADALNGAPGKESDTDLASKAFQIWQSAIERDPRLAKIVPNLQPVLYSTKRYEPAIWKPEGVLAFVRTAEDHDALVWLDRDGNVITESQHTILEAAKCEPETPAVERLTNHHELVRAAVELVAKEEKSSGGQLGRPSSARFRTYERLKHYLNEIKGTLFDTPQLRHAFEDIWNYPLRTAAKDALNRLLRAGVDDDLLAERVVELRDQNKLSVIHDEDETHEPQIICSLGLADTDGTPQS